MSSMKNKPLVSIIVPAYNASSHIERCINSILNQKYESIELFVIDDNSNDDTLEIASKIGVTDGRLKIIHLHENSGIHCARKAGLRLASGELIGFVDSDDWIEPDMYFEMVKSISSCGADIALCSVEKISEDQVSIGKKIFFSQDCVVSGSDIFEYFCCRRFGTGVLWNKLYRSDLIKKYGLVDLDRSVDASEDYIINIGCFADSQKVAILKGCYYNYFIRGNSASRSGDNPKNFVRIIEAYACALRIYNNYSFREKKMLTELYAYQLRFHDYKVRSIDELVPYKKSLMESFSQISINYPEGLYLLINPPVDTALKGRGFVVREKIKKIYYKATSWAKV